jgi:5-oxopent-3-ene-1,2,5-tricarboxylate decarboxylase / 2-hydroxyhepta-2,4-diene-1,7-dioate isomerase
MPAVQTRRILLDGAVTEVTVAGLAAVGDGARGGAALIAADGRQLAAADAVHLPPCQPTKILCVHLTYRSRITEFGSRPPDTPTYRKRSSLPPWAATGSFRGVRPPRRGG